MKVIDQIAAWLIVVLGVIHSAYTLRAYASFNMAAMWFLGTGLLIILVGAVNLLRIRSGSVAPGLRAVCLTANVIVLAYAGAIASRLSLKQNPQAVVVLVLMLLELIFSIVKSSRGQPAAVGAR